MSNEKQADEVKDLNNNKTNLSEIVELQHENYCCKSSINNLMNISDNDLKIHHNELDESAKELSISQNIPIQDLKSDIGDYCIAVLEN